MKQICTILLSIICLHGYSQKPVQSYIADSGKVEFKKQSKSENPDYADAYRILKSQVKLYPNNAELHYFLGYAADRMNSEEGSTMYQMKIKLALEASEHFETVIKLEPIYKGEKIVLDPYAKLSSIWGSLAQAYLIRKLKDSAVWAFKEGKTRGGFIEPVLEYNRQLLNSCSKNAILVTYGDNITIPAWYLQEVENYRTDIKIVDANLINTSWYPKYLQVDRAIQIGFTDEEIEKIDYVEFDDRFMTISNPDDNAEKFTWELKPTYYGKYILKGDRILLNILKENLFKTDIYFSFNSDTTWNLFLNPYFFNDGLADKLLKKGIEINEASDSVSVNLQQYSIANKSRDDILKSPDAIILLNTYRWIYYTNIVRLLNNKQKPKARLLKAELLDKFPVDKLPFISDEQKRYFEKLFSEFD